MMLRAELAKILKDQAQYLPEPEQMVDRELSSMLRVDLPRASIITGVRRSGKSTLLRQFLLENKAASGYIHFDDPRLSSFSVDDFYQLEDLWKDRKYLQFDEIHAVPSWEQYVRQAVERQKHIFITGSNAFLLGQELATLLTGRHSSFELFPFSYSEYLRFRQLDPDEKSLKSYLDEGGFPEFLRYKIAQYHHDLFTDIIQKDIAIRYGIRNVKAFQDLAISLLANPSRQITYHRLAKSHQIKSVKTVSDYVSMLESAYLIFLISQFSESIKKRIRNPKKVYCIDSALVKSLSTRQQLDNGRLLENLVFLHLRRKFRSIFYYQETHECDFVVISNPPIAIQVCWEVTKDNYDREVKGLVEALEYFNLPAGLIITSDQNDLQLASGKEIQILPFYEWEHTISTSTQ